jgi:D-alanine-D-alanine ligase
VSQHVAVIMGGPSVEREVSLVSGLAVEQALKDLGYIVTVIDADRTLPAQIMECDPDVAFNALHGRLGEDGCVQGLLEVLGIPYTHSGVLASALAMNKPAAKKLFAEAGLTCPEGRVMNFEAVMAGDELEPPYVIKPLNEGSSVGVHIVLLVEKYIPGREIQVAVMGERALGAIEIRPRGRFYDYETKYTEGKAEHFMPAPIDPRSYSEALDIALCAHRTLGCRGVSRADLRYDDEAGEPGTFYLLEINTQPGMTPLSLVPEIAADSGMKFADLVAWMVENAACDN